MAIRPLHALAAAGIVIAAAVVAAVVTRAPAVGPTPAATPTPVATPAPGSERYGLIVDTSAGTSVRSEVEPRELGTLATAYFNGAVSPDGGKVAYWETPREGAARVLRLLEGSAPAQPRVVLTLPESEVAAVSSGRGVAWSSDGTGLLIAVDSRDHASGLGADSPSLYATLRHVDLASGSVREIARNERGLWFGPVAWDRARGIAAAVEVGPGGFAPTYVLVRDGAAPIRTPFGMETAPHFVRAAPDASRVFAVGWRPISALYVWPLAEPERRSTMHPATGERVATAMWRNAGEIVVSIDGDVPAAHRLEAWPLEGPRRVLLRGATDLSAVRPDGTAAIVSGIVVDLETGATWPIPGFTGRVEASFLLR